MTLTWTSDPPTVMGYYWFRIIGGGWNQIVCVTSADLSNNIGWANGQWAGPIPEPQEPQKEEK